MWINKQDGFIAIMIYELKDENKKALDEQLSNIVRVLGFGPPHCVCDGASRLKQQRRDRGASFKTLRQTLPTQASILGSVVSRTHT